MMIKRIGPNKGRKLSLKWRENLSLSLRGRKRPPFSEEWKRRIGEKSKGRIKSEAQRMKISISLRGRIFSEEHKKRISNALKGKIRSKKHSENISKSLMGLLINERNPNWNGGISFKPYSREWKKDLKEKIRYRDNYKCKLCGKRQVDKKLCVHHIDYDKLNCCEKNLISLCLNCHLKTNFNRNNWINYFQEMSIIKEK